MPGEKIYITTFTWYLSFASLVSCISDWSKASVQNSAWVEVTLHPSPKLSPNHQACLDTLIWCCFSKIVSEHVFTWTCVCVCAHTKVCSTEERGTLVTETLQGAIAIGKYSSKIICMSFLLLSVRATPSHRNPSSWVISSYAISSLFPGEYTKGSQKL